MRAIPVLMLFLGCTEIPGHHPPEKDTDRGTGHGGGDGGGSGGGSDSGLGGGSGGGTGGGGGSWSADQDSDGDGMTDGEEGATSMGDGVDTDGDGDPDHWDLDSDEDGIADEVEALPREDDGSPADTDGDGTADFRDDDSDDDYIDDLTEGAPATADGPADTDGDGTADYRDEDTDDDAILDATEGTADWDGDGTENWRDARNDGTPIPLNFVAISTDFNAPIGIDAHDSSGKVAMSVNYPSGSPNSLELVSADGSHAAFSTLSGLTDEVKIATVRDDTVTGFAPGELFVGNGNDGEIVRISADGMAISNPWVSLAGSGNGLMRGSLYVDRTGVWNGDLLVCTTVGEVWRIDNTGTSSLVADLNVHLEGLATVPDAEARYGPLAGKAIMGAEGVGLLYAVAPDGTVESYSLGVNVEDIDLINLRENFFGVNYGTSQLLGVVETEWISMTGDILLTQESVSSVGLYLVRWDGSSLSAVELEAASGSATIGQWEHVTFADASIQEI